jgi:hypothetical protein
VEEEVVGPLLYWNVEEVVERAEVLQHELLLESCTGMLEKLQAWGGEDDVVDVAMVDEQWGVRLGLHKVQRDQVGGKAVIPCLQRLLQAVEGLVEPAHQLRVRRVNEAGGLRAVDSHDKYAMEKVFLTLSWCTGQPLETTKVSTVQTVVGLTTRLKVLS